MDSLDRRLIELQGALLKLAAGQPVSKELFKVVILPTLTFSASFDDLYCYYCLRLVHSK
jgi:hypothetical protein